MAATRQFANVAPACLAAALVLLFGSPVSAESWFNAGPLYDRFELTLSPGNRAEALGPILSFQRDDSLREWSFSPICSGSSDSETDLADFDLLYPLVTYSRYGAEYRFQILQLFSFAGGAEQDETVKSRFTLFPFYFQQRSTDPEKNYTALFPIYGSLQNRLFRDEIKFILWPGYVWTRKRDVETHNYLFPFFHARSGDELSGWQFWPLVGREHKSHATRTNQYDEMEIVPGHKKFFALWPIYFNQTTGLGTENPEHQRAVLPLYSSLRSPKRDSTTFLWPFFTITDDREKKYREWDFPWPLVVMARGEGKTTTRVWPLFSRAKNPVKQSDFYLWPIYKYNRLTAPPADRERTRILFFLYSDIVERDTISGDSRRRMDLWPLFTHKRDLSGNTRLQALALLEPLLPNNSGIERNYSPLWSIWRAERNGQRDATSQSLLWNLYRRDTSSESKKLSLLFGLFQYQSDAKAARLRVLYVPFSKKHKCPDAQDKKSEMK